MHEQTDAGDGAGGQVASADRVIILSFDSDKVTREDILGWAGKPGPQGKILAVTGHRPEKIGGYDETSPMRRAVRSGIRKALKRIRPTVGISGMALGVDQDFALECIALSIPFVAAVPFPGQDAVWRPEARERYEALLRQACATVHVYPGPYAPWKLQRRNEWMVDRSGDILAVFDGSAGGTRNCVEYARSLSFPPARLCIIDPKDLLERPSGPTKGPAYGSRECASC